jgi:hypothetical protein
MGTWDQASYALWFVGGGAAARAGRPGAGQGAEAMDGGAARRRSPGDRCRRRRSRRSPRAAIIVLMVAKPGA